MSPLSDGQTAGDRQAVDTHDFVVVAKPRRLSSPSAATKKPFKLPRTAFPLIQVRISSFPAAAAGASSSSAWPWPRSGRMRSAETPNSSAKSCSVAGSSLSQRASTIRRLRSSSPESAVCRPSLCRWSRSRALQHARRFAAAVFQIGNGSEAFFVVASRFQGDIVSGQARFHLDDFFRLDAQLVRHVGYLCRRQRFAARLHAAQVEEQLALRLGPWPA